MYGKKAWNHTVKAVEKNSCPYIHAGVDSMNWRDKNNIDYFAHTTVFVKVTG